MMQIRLRQALVVVASVGVLSLGAPRDAHAVCGDPSTDGAQRSTSVTTGGGMAASLNPSIPHPTLGKTLIAENDTVHVMDTATLAEDDTEAPGDPIENTPNVVELDDGSFAAFVAHDNGDVSRINPGDADDGIAASTDWTVSTGRGACSADSMTATPVVHLRRFATTSFRALYSTDLVYVATRYGCDSSGGRTDNIIRALNAETGATVWTFNGSATVDLDEALADVLHAEGVVLPTRTPAPER